MASQPPPPPQPTPSSAVEQPETDHINRLPDELLLLIFTKIHNAKSLCICNLICKRFSVIVHQTPSISLTFPHRSSNSHDNNLPKKLFNYLSKSFFRKPPPNNFDGALFQSAIDSLKGFHRIRDMRIELPSFQQDESIVKWHAEFGRGSNVCMILFATSLHHQSNSVQVKNCQPCQSVSSNIQNHPDTSLTNHLLQTRIASSNQCFREATWRQHVLRHVVENHRHTLETAEICDSDNKGRVIINNKQHVNDLLDPEVRLPASGYGKLWHVQLLRLPESRCVLYGATVVAIRRTDEGEEECEDVGVKRLMKERCEQGLLWEVLTHILESHAPARSLNINAARRQDH